MIIIFNVGNGYNNYDGVFIVLIDGIYVFFCKIIISINNFVSLYFEFILNGFVKIRNLVYSRLFVLYRIVLNLIVL